MSINHAPLIVWQFTDTHLGADPETELMGVNVLASLRRVLTEARADTPRPDLVIATGDLVHDESVAGYRRLAEAFAELNAPVYCLPGNHDDPALMREILVDESARYAGEWRAGAWQVILLDSTQPNETAGYLPREELERLHACLQRRPELHALVCLHHPPVKIGSPWMDAMGLQNGDEFFESISGYPQVRGIVWGHNHQEFEAERRGVRLLGTPSTCIQFMPRAERFELDAQPPGYRWLRLHADGGIESAVRRVE